jgi:hypothetical protein
MTVEACGPVMSYKTNTFVTATFGTAIIAPLPAALPVGHWIIG